MQLVEVSASIFAAIPFNESPIYLLSLAKSSAKVLTTSASGDVILLP
jgi:hypothetical protein